MQFRNERRRRVVAEEIHGAADGSDGQSLRVAETTGKGGKAYSDAAHRDHQPHVTDLVPRRARWFVLLAGLGMAAVGALELMHYWRMSLEDVASPESLQALDMSQVCSLSGWFSSVLWSMCSAAAILLYRIRRHRVDDYHGRYRIWLWLAALACWMSMNVLANLNGLVVALSAGGLARYKIPAGAFWTTFCGVLGAYLGLRVVFEIRRCRGATLALVMAATIAAYLAAKAQWGFLPAGEQALMITAGLQLLGQLCLLLAAGLYGRHVLLEVEGLIQQRAPKPKRPRRSRPTAQRTESDPADSQTKPHVKLHASTGPVVTAASKSSAERLASKAAPPSKATTPSKSTTDAFDPEDLLENRGESRGLSRAERKRLRREKLQQRAA